ncbi:MAG TPA: hypothetical protein VGI87_01685 [Solirubrobacteraceae bacterium]
MLAQPNALQWDGTPGHYEVYYLTVTDPATGVGLWIRYTMLAPLERTGEPATCALWLLAMDPRPGSRGTLGRKGTFPIEQLRTEADRFELEIAGATLTDRGMAGRFEDVRWELSWDPSPKHYEHVHAGLRRAGIAQTVLVLPHGDVAVRGTVDLPGERLTLADAPGGQAHLWGSKHARRWAWVHCNDFEMLDGAPARGEMIDAVSVFVSRGGREVGPNTPVVGRVLGQEFTSTSPWRVVRNRSTFALTGWRFETIAGGRKLIGEVDAERDLLAGVTYHDPDGEPAYCYNSEAASMRVHVYERARRVGGWAHLQTLTAPGRAHFEYAQRTPIAGLDLLTT